MMPAKVPGATTDGMATILHIGDRPPDLDLLDHDGLPWRFADHRGRPVVVILHRHLA